MCNNQAAINIAKNTLFANRIKHWRVHLHWIRERVAKNDVSTHYISTHSNLADFLTKSLSRVKHSKCIEGINLTG
jgi:hypothetical protein